MKAITKKLLLATVATTSFFHLYTGEAVVHAEKVIVQPTETSDNEVEVNEKDYTINEEKTELEEGDEYSIIYGGRNNYEEEVKNNSVTINENVAVGKDTLEGAVLGGRSYSGNVEDNSVSISGGEVSISGSSIGGAISGGHSYSGNVSNNSVTIYNSTLSHRGSGDSLGGAIFGGRSSTGDVSNNNVTINKGTIADSGSSSYPGGATCGGYSSSGDANNNSVTIIESTIANSKGASSPGSEIYGGRSDGGDANYNSVTITNSTITEYDSENNSSPADVYGGYSSYGNANNNSVIIGGSSLGTIFGGYNANDWSTSGTANNNSVQINSGDILRVIGAYSRSGNVTGNNTLINGGTFLNIDGAYTTSGDATNNSVTINDGTISWGITGAYSAQANVNNNSVIIKGGTINAGIYGGLSDISSGEGIVSYNSVEINGGTIAGQIKGGNNTNNDATNNTVTINGGTINSDIYGGYVYAYNGSGNASNNIINIYNNPNLTNANLFGGFTESGTVSGNALNIYTKNISAKNISNFDAINFYLPESTVNGDTILTLSESSTDISGAVVNAGVQGNANLKAGDTITLLTNAGTITDTGTTYGKLTEGVSLAYDLTVKKDGDNKIIATIGNVDSGEEEGGGTFNDKMEIITIPPLPLINPPEPPNEDFDFEEEGLSSFFNDETKGSWEIFANAGGGPMRYRLNNGHVDTTNQNANMGFARSVGNIAGQMTIAPVIDYQNTNYDSYLNDGTHARGNSKYTGGGFVLRNLYRSGLYFETSFRAGRVRNNFASDDLKTAAYNNTVTYNTSAPVYNGHLKLGKYLRLDKNNLLDIYGFYYHTHQGGSNADLSSGEHYNFSSTNAGRARIGYRLTTRTSRISQVYTGLAYQYEYNNGVTATYKGYSTSGDSHSGSSGMLEIGWLIKPFKNNLWGVHLNTTGWIGNQRGVKAFAKIQKTF